MALRYSQKTVFNMASLRHLEFEKFRFFFKFSCSEWKFVSVQIWLKSDNSRLRYGDKAIFKMAAIHHLEFAKIAVLVTWTISACYPSFCSKFCVDRPIWRRNIAKKRFSIWCPSAMLNLKNFDFWQIAILGVEICIGIPNWSKSDNSQLRCGYKAIFKMSAVRHLEYAKIADLGHVTYIGMWSFISVANFALIGQYSAEI